MILTIRLSWKTDILSMNNKKYIIKYAVMITLFWFSQYVYVPYQTPFLSGINVSATFIGVVIGIYGFSQMILRTPLGIAADWKLNHQLLIFIGCLLAGIASLFRLLMPSGIGFLIGNILSGIASSTWLSFMILFFKINSPKTKDESMGFLVMFNNLGMLLGFIASSLLYKFIAMRGLCILSLIAGITSCLLSIHLPKFAYKNNNLNLIGKNFRKLFLNKKFLLCSFLAFVQQGIQMSTTMSFTTEVVEKLSNVKYAEGLSSIIYMLSAVIFAKMTASKIIKKIDKRKIVVFSFIMLGGYCWLVPNMTSVYEVYALQLIPGFATGILFAFLNSDAIGTASERFISSATGLFQTLYAIGMTIFPVIAGYLENTFSLAISFYVFAGISVFAALIGVYKY